MSKRQPNAHASAVELAQARAELDRLVRENAELRARALLDEQLGSDAARHQAIFANLAEGIHTKLGDGQIPIRGDILVESEPGVGTRFAIYLPLTSDHVETVDERPRARRTTADEGRILLAEDDAIVRMVAERGLRAHGYEVTAVPDGHTALALIADGGLDVDLLVSDVIMPNMTGYELAQKLRAQLPELKVLFVSGYADGAFDPDGPGHDITDAIYLPKPYTGSQLARFVERILAD